MLLDEARFDEVMSGFKRHAFRLETLDVYDVGEDDEIARYLRGEPTPDPEDHEPWPAWTSTTISGCSTTATSCACTMTQAAGSWAPRSWKKRCCPLPGCARDAALGAAESFASYWHRHPEYH
jgi:hypothetical protein